MKCSSSHLLLLAFSILTLWGGSSCSVQAADFNVVGREMARILQNGHYARREFSLELSERILENYLNHLDPTHSYFLQSDVDEFRNHYGRRLHELLITEKTTKVADLIFQRFRLRVEERMRNLKEMLAHPEGFDFTQRDSVMQDRSEAPWPRDEAQARLLWRKQVAEAILSETLRREGIEKKALEKGLESPLSGELPIVEKIAKRYERFSHSIADSDPEDVANYFLSAVAQAYDPHTEYMSAREMDRFDSDMQNKLVGIGALLQAVDDGATEIMGIVKGGPAEKQGQLQLKDRVIAVDPLNNGEFVDIMFMELGKVVDLIRGELGTEVRLKVEPAGAPAGETRDIVIQRGVVELKDELAQAQVIEVRDEEGLHKLGYLNLPSFYADFREGKTSSSRDVEALLMRLKKEGIQGLAIDLRGNGGGSLDDVRRITGLFTGRGPVVQVKSASGHLDALDSPYRQPLYDGPLVVLTDKASASASEILAGALQDYHRAVIVGESSTFGKGTVQRPMEIARFMPFLANADRAGVLKITTQKFYRVSGSSTQLEGVVPDVVLPALTDALEFGEGDLDFALPHDEIQRAANFRPQDAAPLFLADLSRQSAERVAASPDFQYIQEDVKRLRERLARNEVSLNREERQQEIEDNELRRKTRNAERQKRFEKMSEEDEKTFTFYRLNLDDLKTTPLPKVAKNRDDDDHMRRAKNKLDDLDDTPEWPSDLDPVKREGLAILLDLVERVEASQVAGVLPTAAR